MKQLRLSDRQWQLPGLLGPRGGLGFNAFPQIRAEPGLKAAAEGLKRDLGE